MAEQNEVSTTAQNSPGTDVHLEDEKHVKEDHFVGATLEISGDGVPKEPVTTGEVSFAGPGIDRNRPGSMMGRQSVQSTGSKTSMKPYCYKSEKDSDTFFSYKENNLEKALEKCKADLYKQDLDGNILGRWLLTEIDHWDNEREKIVVLAENSTLVFRYNFITNVVLERRRIMHHIIESIKIGDFKYPEWSIMPFVSSDRLHGGIQVSWNKGEEPSFGQRWNPWCSTIPWLTLAHHPLIYNPKEHETITYNVDEFYESLLTAVSKAFSRKRPGEKVTVIEGQIEIQSYASITSMVFNQSCVGYSKDRNGLCF